MNKKASSDRSFGLVFAAVFVIVAIWPLLNGGQLLWWSTFIAGGFLIVALLRPVWLQPLHRIWTWFGDLLHKMVNPLVMILLYFLVVTPIGLLMRMLNKKLLRLEFDPKTESYWIAREQPGPTPESMKYQF